MARLRHPDKGTTITVGGDLERRYRAAGWASPDEPQSQEDGVACDQCDFTAKSPRGLSVHQRSHD